jgi:hypothetical protein
MTQSACTFCTEPPSSRSLKMVSLLLLVASTAVAAVRAAGADGFLANWMGSSAGLIANASLLDLALPGSHDTMTYDLSTALSDGYEGLPAAVSKILHALTPLVAGEFIRDQGRTQGTNVTAQLDGGLRFLDFRTLYSGGKGGKEDWYCLHGCQTNHPSLDYLRQIRQWLDGHPKEVIVMWFSRHGDYTLNGTKQYPGTTVAQRRAYWSQIESVFDGKLIDSSHGPLNAVTMGEHWSIGSQVALYATDYVEFTGSSTKAIDAMLIDNQLGGNNVQDIPKGITDGLGTFSAATRASNKAQNRFYLVSMASSGAQVTEAVEIKYVPFAKKEATKACAKLYHIPNMSGWCPLTLMDQGLLANYYNQYTLEAAYQGMKAAANGDGSGSAGSKYEFPNAIYIDGIDAAGKLRTGPGQICGECLHLFRAPLPFCPPHGPRRERPHCLAGTRSGRYVQDRAAHAAAHHIARRGRLRIRCDDRRLQLPEAMRQGRRCATRRVQDEHGHPRGPAGCQPLGRVGRRNARQGVGSALHVGPRVIS